MITVTAFRSIPKPIIGMVRVENNGDFARLEDALDWLETTGAFVERFDPGRDLEALASYPAVRQMVAQGEDCLPLILVDGVVALRGVWPSRPELARAIGRMSLPGRHAA